MTTAGTGWPVLVGAGRRRDYSTLLAPDFLIATREYGVLSEVLTPSPAGAAPTVLQVTTAGGQRLAIAYVTHPVTTADVADRATADGDDPTPLRDEHSRPLRFIFGFLCLDASFREPAAADLRTAHMAALRAYRRFLDDEEGFTVLPSAGFAMRTPVRPQSPPRKREPAVPGHRKALWWAAALVVGTLLAILGVAATRDAEPPCTAGRPAPGSTTAPTASPGCRE